VNGSRSHEVDVGSSLRTGIKTKAVLSPTFLLHPGPLPGAHFFFYMRRAPERSSGENQISDPKNRVWRRYTPHKTSENGGRPHWTSPSRLSPMGPNFQIHVYEPLVEPHGDLWAQGATFGRVGPLRRQLLLLLHPCLAYLSQPLECSDGPENGRSARRPT
jgi:hypothetical protein